MTGSGGYRTSSHSMASTDATATTPATTHPTAGRERDETRRTGVDASRPGRVARKRLPARAVTGIMTACSAPPARSSPHWPRGCCWQAAPRWCRVSRARRRARRASPRHPSPMPRSRLRRSRRCRSTGGPSSPPRSAVPGATSAGSSRCTPATAGCRACGRPPTWRARPSTARRPMRWCGTRMGSSPRSCAPTGPRACWWSWPTRWGTPCRAGWASTSCRRGSRRATPRSCWRRWPTAPPVSRSPTSRRSHRRASRSAPTGATGRCRRSSPSRIRSASSPAMPEPTATRSTACRRSRTATTAPPPRARR